MASLRRRAVSWSIARLRNLPPALLSLPLRVWTRNLFEVSRRDADVVLGALEEMETLPTIRRGLRTLGMRSMLEWSLCADEIARMPSPYTHPLQRPTFFHPGVRASAFGERSPWMDRLEGAVPDIREELFSALARRRGFQPYRPIGIDRPGEAWNVLYLHLGGERAADAAPYFPRTFAAIESIPGLRKVGVSCFSALNPGARVAPHCGPMNGTLRVHLCIEGGAGSTLTVGGEERALADGRAHVFDDSFEHAVLHAGAKTRFVLLLEIWHPDWTAEEVRRLEALHDTLRRTRWSRAADAMRKSDRDVLAGQVWWIG